MLYKLLGCLWIVLGLLWLIKPEALKNRLKRKMSRGIRWVVYGFIVIFGLSLIGSIIKAQGLLPKIIGFIGIIITVKCMLLFTSKASEKILDKLAGKSLLFFRIWALFIFIIGLTLVFI